MENEFTQALGKKFMNPAKFALEIEKLVKQEGINYIDAIVLYCEVKRAPGQPNEHVFRTTTNGSDTCKTPIDMFEEEHISNDLSIVDKAINEYY